MASVVSVRGGGGDRYDGRGYYPGTYIEDGERSYSKGHAYREYGAELGPQGHSYYTTQEPFNPDSDYYKR